VWIGRAKSRPEADFDPPLQAQKPFQWPAAGSRGASKHRSPPPLSPSRKSTVQTRAKRGQLVVVGQGRSRRAAIKFPAWGPGQGRSHRGLEAAPERATERRWTSAAAAARGPVPPDCRRAGSSATCRNPQPEAEMHQASREVSSTCRPRPCSQTGCVDPPGEHNRPIRGRTWGPSPGLGLRPAPGKGPAAVRSPESTSCVMRKQNRPGPSRKRTA